MSDARRAMGWPRRRGLIDEPARGRSVRGVSSLSFPARGDVFAIVDVALFGEKEAGKTQFVLNALATLRAQSPEAEDTWILDAARTQTLPTATDTLVPRICQVPFRSIAHKLSNWMLFRLAIRQWWIWLELAILALCAAGSMLYPYKVKLHWVPDWMVSLGWRWQAIVGVCAAVLLVAMRFQLKRYLVRQRNMDIEIVFWDIAGEHVYGASDPSELEGYRNALKHLIDRRSEIAQREGHRYLFAPVLICNPLSVVHPAADTPFIRLQRVMFQFQGLFRNAARRDSRLLSVVTRGDLVSFLEDSRRLPHDRPLRVYSMRRGDNPYEIEPVENVLFKADVLEACVERQWDSDSRYRMRYDASVGKVFTFDSWVKEQNSKRSYWVPERVHDHCQLFYEFRESPEGFKGRERDTFLSWLTDQLWATSARKAAQSAAPPLSLLRQPGRPSGSEYQPGS